MKIIVRYSIRELISELKDVKRMSWFVRRQVKKFIANPNAILIVNPKFCEHSYDVRFHKKLKQNVYYCIKCNKILDGVIN